MVSSVTKMAPSSYGQSLTACRSTSIDTSTLSTYVDPPNSVLTQLTTPFTQPTNSFLHSAFSGKKQEIARQVVSTPAVARSFDESRLATRAQSAAPPACTNASHVEINCIRQLYGTADYVPKAADRNNIATTGFLGEHASYVDFSAMMRRQRPDQAGYMFKGVGVNGTQNTQEPSWWRLQTFHGIEGNMDAQLTGGIVGAYSDFWTARQLLTGDSSAPIPSTFYSFPNLDPMAEPFQQFADYMLALPDAALPSTVSTSCASPKLACD